MKEKSVLLLCIITLLFGNAFAATKQNMADLTGKFSEALAKGDAKNVVAIYSKNAQLLPPNRDVVTGTEAITGFWKSAIDFGIKARQFEPTDFVSMGNNAIEIGKYRLRDPKGKQIEAGKYMMLWIKEGGLWKLHRDMWSSNTAEGCL